MTDTDKPRPKTALKADAARRERLAMELRANLKRRKAQAKARASKDGPEDTPGNDVDAGAREGE